MKKSLVLLVVTLMIAAVLAACGGGGAAAPEPQAEVPAVVEEAAEAVVDAPAEEEPAEEAPAEETAAEEPVEAPAEAETADAPAEEPDDAADDTGAAAADLQMSGIDPDTGLEINPAVTAPGVDYIIRGTLSSYNLIPQESPEFLIDGPNGVRYRIRTQPVPEIFVTDGSQIALHEYTRGIPVQATARLTESSRATSIMESTNLVLLAPTP